MGRIVSSLSVQKAMWQGWNQYSHLPCEIYLIQSFPFAVLAMVKDDIQLHNQLEFMNFKLKFESSIVKKKKNHIFFIWGSWKDFRGPRGLEPSWDCVLFHVYAHFSMKQALNFYTCVAFSRGYVNYIYIFIYKYIKNILLYIYIYTKNVRIIMLREKELQTSVTCFKEARNNWPKFKFCVKKIALYRLSK